MTRIGPLIIDIASSTLSPEDREILAHPLVGGVIYFSRNYENPQQLQALSQQIRASRRLPLLIMADQEGGRVQRFREGLTILPPMGTYGVLYENDPTAALRSAKNHAKQMATELRAMGVDLSLAPVLDLDKGLNAVIGDRAFHADPAIVQALAAAFVTGMREAGMAACAKHFPGHGSVDADSHLTKPIDRRAKEAIWESDLLPFAGLIKSGISAIMAAHITFPNVDQQPAGFSHIWLQTILRQQLGFEGTLFTDDLTMAGAAISDDYADRVVAAREAGCDFALLCNNREGVVQAIDGLKEADHYVEQMKWEPLLGSIARMTIS